MYTSPTQLRLVGKAWEIRHRLKQLLHEHGEHQTLKQILVAPPGSDTPIRHLHLV